MVFFPWHLGPGTGCLEGEGGVGRQQQALGLPNLDLNTLSLILEAQVVFWLCPGIFLVRSVASECPRSNCIVPVFEQSVSVKLRPCFVCCIMALLLGPLGIYATIHYISSFHLISPEASSMRLRLGLQLPPELSTSLWAHLIRGMMALFGLAIALDAIDVTTRMTALHLSEDVALKTAQFTMDSLVRHHLQQVTCSSPASFLMCSISVMYFLALSSFPAFRVLRALTK